MPKALIIVAIFAVIATVTITATALYILPWFWALLLGCIAAYSFGRIVAEVEKGLNERNKHDK